MTYFDVTVTGGSGQSALAGRYELTAASTTTYNKQKTQYKITKNGTDYDITKQNGGTARLTRVRTDQNETTYEGRYTYKANGGNETNYTIKAVLRQATSGVQTNAGPAAPIAPAKTYTVMLGEYAKVIMPRAEGTYVQQEHGSVEYYKGPDFRISFRDPLKPVLEAKESNEWVSMIELVKDTASTSTSTSTYTGVFVSYTITIPGFKVTENQGSSTASLVKTCTRPDITAFPGYMLVGTGATSTTPCGETLTAGQRCTLTCGGNVFSEIACGVNGGSITTQKTCPKSCEVTPNTYPPNYNRVNFGVGPKPACQGTLRPDEYCFPEKCTGATWSVYRCDGTTGTMRLTDVACTPDADTVPPAPPTPPTPPATPMSSTCKLPGQYGNYQLLVGEDPQPGVCPAQMATGTSCVETTCNAATSKRNKITCSVDSVQNQPTIKSTGFLDCDPPTEKTCNLDAKYSGYKFLGLKREVDGRTRETLQTLPSCPSELKSLEMCLALECTADGKRKAVMCLTDGELQDTDYAYTGCYTPPARAECTRPGSITAGAYAYYKNDAFNANECPAKMELGSYCLQNACDGNNKKKITCEARENIVQGTEACVKVTDPILVQAKITYDSNEAIKKAEDSQTVVAQQTTTVTTIVDQTAGAEKNLNVINAGIVDATSQVNTLAGQRGNEAQLAELQTKIAAMTADKTKAEQDLEDLRKKQKEEQEKLLLAQKQAEADAQRAKELADKAKGGAAPSVAATSLQCGLLASSVPATQPVVCDTTGISSLVAIKRGTISVPVTVYMQASSGSWVGYGVAPDQAPWKGVYVTIRPSASRGVPHSVECVWHTTPPTIVAYKASVASVAGTLVLVPTVPEATPTETTMSLISGPNPFPVHASPPAPAPASSADSGLSVGEIAGIVAGSVVGGLLLIALLIYVLKRRSGPRGPVRIAPSDFSY